MALIGDPRGGGRPAGILGALGVRAGERAMVAWVTAVFAVTQASHGLGANTADTLFFLRFGVEYLPIMILVSGPVVMAAMLGHASGLGRWGTARWLPAVLWGTAGWLVLERAGVAVHAPGIYPVVWLGGQVTVLVSFIVMWNAAAEVCTTRQAKRLFPLFASAGIGGGILGNAATGPAAAWLGTHNLLLIHAGLLALAAVLMSSRVRQYFRSVDQGPRTSTLTDLRDGLRVTVGTPLLRLAAGTAVAFSVLFFLVVFPFAESVTTSFDDETDVAGYLGTFSAVATAVTFGTSLFGANRLFARRGVVATLLLVPVVYVAGFGLWLLSFGLVSATLVRGAQWVAVNALGGTAWSSLFNVLGDRRRGQVIAFMAGVPTQIGTMIAGMLLLVGSSLHHVVRAAIGLCVACVALVLVARMRTAYTAALVDAVSRGLVDVFTAPAPGIQKPALDADTHTALTTSMHSQDPLVRLVAASMLGRLGGVGDEVGAALGDVDPRVRVAALDAVARDGAVVPFARRMLLDHAPSVRRRAATVLEAHDDDLGGDADAALSSPDPHVRASAAVLVDARRGVPVIDAMLESHDPGTLEAALSASARRRRSSTVDPVLFVGHHDRRVRAAAARAMAAGGEHLDALRDLLDDSSTVVRAAAAGGLAQTAGGTAVLLDVLRTGSVRTTDAALRALTIGPTPGAVAGVWAGAGIGSPDGSTDGSDSAVGESVGGGRWRGRPRSMPRGLDSWVRAEVDRATRLRAYAQALETPDTDGGPQVASATRTSLVHLLRARQERLQRWALQALDATLMQHAMPMVRRGVWSPDPDVRAQALEALDSMTDRAVARGLIALLEDSVPTTPRSDREVLWELTGDFDEWIRALAIRTLVAECRADLDLLRRTAADDPRPLVTTAVAREEPNVDDVHVLDTIDRVVSLQRVRMFADLDAEDLERIASAMTERRYRAGDMVFHLGQPGDEMLVIVAGGVQVLRAGGVPIRELGPGEHVGELALLSGRPRAADVLATDEGVHGLVLGTAALVSILEERPEVAMAMLATLAERLGSM